MKRLIFLLLPLIFTINSYAQSGYSTSNFYAVRGTSTTETSYKNVWSDYYGWQSIRYCRQLSWHQEWYAGYVYYWQWDSFYGQYRWSSQWQEGNFWYCTWSAWYAC